MKLRLFRSINVNSSYHPHRCQPLMPLSSTLRLRINTCTVPTSKLFTPRSRRLPRQDTTLRIACWRHRVLIWLVSLVLIPWHSMILWLGWELLTYQISHFSHHEGEAPLSINDLCYVSSAFVAVIRWKICGFHSVLLFQRYSDALQPLSSSHRVLRSEASGDRDSEDPRMTGPQHRSLPERQPKADKDDIGDRRFGQIMRVN